MPITRLVDRISGEVERAICPEGGGWTNTPVCNPDETVYRSHNRHSCLSEIQIHTQIQIQTHLDKERDLNQTSFFLLGYDNGINSDNDDEQF